MGGTGIPYGEMLRGYTENRVGPFGSTRGGDIMLKYSLELRLSLSENPTIYALSFFDMGNVWSGFDVLDPFDLKRSAGVGVRVFIPMLGCWDMISVMVLMLLITTPTLIMEILNLTDGNIT